MLKREKKDLQGPTPHIHAEEATDTSLHDAIDGYASLEVRIWQRFEISRPDAACRGIEHVGDALILPCTRFVL
jgi:hypothetical protein